MTVVRARRYDPTATAAVCSVCGQRLDHAMYPYCSDQLPLEQPARRPAHPTGALFTLDDVADDLTTIEALARENAATLGYRPRSAIIFTARLDEYEKLVGQAALAVAGGRRGLCGPGPSSTRVIWVAAAGRWDLFETITHEIAHAVLPLRLDHTPHWLDVHVGTLARVTSTQHAALARRRSQEQYGL